MAPEVKERNRRATVCNRSTSCRSLMSALGRKQALLESDFVLSYSRLDVTASLSADSLARGSLTPSDRDQAWALSPSTSPRDTR